MVFPKNEPEKINILKSVSNKKTLVVAVRRFDKYFVVTGFETDLPEYISSIKKRGEVINIAGRALGASIANPDSSSERRQQELSGVGNITTSLSDNIAEKTEKVKDLIDEEKPKKKSKGYGFSL
jgi:hypothetical protein